MTLPFDHTHDLELGVSRSESEIVLSQEWVGGGVVGVGVGVVGVGGGGGIDNERKRCESSIHDHDIDLCDHGGHVGGCTG